MESSMRKSVKLVASALAAVAVVGGSATAASAHDKPSHKPTNGKNVCGNNSGSLVSTAGNSDASLDDIIQTGQTQQVICQVGQENNAVTYNETLIAGDDLVLAIGEVAEDLMPQATVTT
jgi:hypothetical protein